ncbi:bifunctional DNA-formamidopyrimidine glycosylase/DNA-(apurinic or apyrimidinic site) lyase [Aeromicrobium sp. SMF47]|uniref:bifunctional DNA-formamidopyrimidine glycosylase/DNA-(apurinic or apyrimidinic site) lyase n=1 Tax=Aeromicrobium TaxID=2040 RepID=UPI0013C06A77|nr:MULTISPECIES: bifunctional DNA-formamidopyrimidine glycosylase/DNA-(apurinic or apyrimidinic site) lyase [Aeromicrobium]MRJ77958.1 bifunctional DNA-formamidopyrimidine glycosylase/DNA-(apurinic or apyrimidinic site) lyase [Aeromicrobium yanjiei]MRK02318.1 bifunctional DNA-formamidopyrimidine glycosylase/DNA-(apurinic or apyrimidinic site) lyase [Aeromicrobium sp. S22]
MPELPEVEVVRRGIADHVVGRTITGVTVHDVRSVRRHLAGPADFRHRLEGRTVVGAARRGKYLWIQLADPEGGASDAILCHLGMSGQFLVSDASAPPQRHLRITLELDDGNELRFADQRIFGGMSFSEDGAELPPEIAHIARDPLDPLFDPAEFAARIRRRQTGVKRAILDQTLISGVGNIYADEALWRTPLHYARNTRHLRTREIESLLGHIGDVMREALAQGGTSFDALYVNVNGNSGYFDRSLQAYGQEGRPCQRCGTPIRRDPFMNRSSFWCPVCQPRPRNGRF